MYFIFITLVFTEFLSFDFKLLKERNIFQKCALIK